MSADKYPSIFSRQMKAIVYLFTDFDWFLPMIYKRTDARLTSPSAFMRMKFYSLLYKTNLVPRVLGLFGVSARRDSGIIDLNHIFDWPLANNDSPTGSR